MFALALFNLLGFVEIVAWFALHCIALHVSFAVCRASEKNMVLLNLGMMSSAFSLRLQKSFVTKSFGVKNRRWRSSNVAKPLLWRE